MGHQTCLQRIGFATMFLAAGVLGGLLAPSFAEAQMASGMQPPSLVEVTLRVDNGTVENVTGNLVPCSNTEITAGYNWCYEVARGLKADGVTPIPNSAVGVSSNKKRRFSILPYSAGSNEARILISDFKNINKMTPTGFRVVPTVNGVLASSTVEGGAGWSNTEAHTVTLTFKVRFDSYGNYAGCSSNCTNTDDAGNYYIGFGSGGQFQPNPYCGLTLCSPSNTVNSDRTDISLKGDFSPTRTGIVLYDTTQNDVPTDSAKATKPHYHAESTASTTGVQYSKYDHINNYPASGDCRKSNDPTNLEYLICAPTLTLTQQYFFFGPDSLNSAGSHHVEQIRQDLCFKPQGPPSNNPNNPCKNRSGKKTTNTQEALDADLKKIIDDEINFNNNEIPPFLFGKECGAPDAEPCRCTGPECIASYILIVNTSSFDYPTVPSQSFIFSVAGPGMGEDPDGTTPKDEVILVPTVQPDGTIVFTGRKEWNNLPVFGGTWQLKLEGYPPHPVEGKKWDLDTINCTSAKYGTLLEKTTDWTDWTEPSGEPKTGHEVLSLQGNDILTCVWGIHTKSINAAK